MPSHQRTRNYTARKLAGKKPGAMPGGLPRAKRNQLQSTPSALENRIISHLTRTVKRRDRARIRAGVLHAAHTWGLKNTRIIDRLQTAAISRGLNRGKFGIEIINLETLALRWDTIKTELQKPPRIRNRTLLHEFGADASSTIEQARRSRDKIRVLIKGTKQIFDELYDTPPEAFQKIFNSKQTAQTFWNTIRQFVFPHEETH